MNTVPRLRLLALSLLTVIGGSSLLRADFDDDYAVGTAGNYNLVSGVTTDFSEWTGLLTTSGATGGSGSINTSSSPGSLTLSTTGNAEMGTGTVAFSFDSFDTAGTVSFSFSKTGSFAVTLDNVVQTAVGSDYSFAVNPGQTLVFQVTATGTMGMMMWDPVTMTPMHMPGFASTSTATISNFTGPISAIPEPSAYAALLGGATLMAAVGRRRSRVACA